MENEKSEVRVMRGFQSFAQDTGDGQETQDSVGDFIRYIIHWQLQCQEEGTVPELSEDILKSSGMLRIQKAFDRYAAEQFESYMTAFHLLRGKLDMDPFEVPENLLDYSITLKEIRKTAPLEDDTPIEFFEGEGSNLLAYRRYQQGEREGKGELLVISNLGGRMEHVHTSYDIVSYLRILGNYEPARDKKEMRPFECVVLKHR